MIATGSGISSEIVVETIVGGIAGDPHTQYTDVASVDFNISTSARVDKATHQVGASPTGALAVHRVVHTVEGDRLQNSQHH